MSTPYTETLARFNVNANASAGVDCSAAPGANNVVVVDDLIIACASACMVTFSEETTGTALLIVHLADNDTKVVPLGTKLRLDTPGKKLRVTSSITTALKVMALYHQERGS